MSDLQAKYEDINGQADVTLTTKEVNERKTRADLLARVDFAALTVEQQNLCLTRLKLLKYIDRLATYEASHDHRIRPKCLIFFTLAIYFLK